VGERAGHLNEANAATARAAIHGEHFPRRRWTAFRALSVYDWEDKLRPTARDVTRLAVGGVSTEPGGRSDAEWEHEMNRLVGQRFLTRAPELTVTK
jgi:hypothetical protein